jgi:hypothetical protein
LVQSQAARDAAQAAQAAAEAAEADAEAAAGNVDAGVAASAASATAAAGSASSAATSATNASSSASSASTSASNAASSASSASTSASSASTSATNAGNSATAAASSASSAAASETSSLIAVTHFGTLPPSSPIVGKRWVNTDDGREYIYLNDGDSSQWVELSGPTSTFADSDNVRFQQEGQIPTTVQQVLRQFSPLGSNSTGVWYRTGTNYESAGTVAKTESRPFLHDFRPTVANGSDFNTDGANLFVGFGAGNFTMKAVPLASLPAGKDYNLQCSHNVGFGVQALSAITIGYKNTGIGTNAWRKLTEGHGNTALGRDSGHELTVGDENTTLGFASGFGLISGNYNLSGGASALYNNSTGSGNTALGRRASFDFLSGNYNTTLGELSGTGQATGSYNTFIGKQVVNNGITTGSNNTVIGSRVEGLENVSGQVVLASGDGTKVLEVNPLGTEKSRLDLVSKDVTAINLAATDGQADKGSTLLLRSAANVGNAITQIAFQSRTGQPWSRIVSWGGVTPNMSIVTNNVEVARWNSAGDFQQKLNSSAAALGVNSTMTFQLTSNTSLVIRVRGTDGITRSATLALS